MAYKIDLFNELLKNFIEVVPDIDAVIVSDDNGLIVASKLKDELKARTDSISVLSSLVTPILERIQYEFSFKKFGTASFETDENRLLFVSATENVTVSLVMDSMGSIDKAAPYAYFLAEKCAQISTADDDQVIQVYIPNFEYDEKEEFERIKNQIYQMRLAQGIYKFKFIIVGDHEVGKTSIVRRFVENRYSNDYRATIGLNILSHTYKFLDTMINFIIWDFGAQKYFRRVRKTYYQGAHSAFIMFDLTNRETFENLNNWFLEIKDYIEREIPIVVVGNKNDLENERDVTYQEGVGYAMKIGASYIETSAKTGDNVEDAFALISYHYIMNSQLREENKVKANIQEELKQIFESKEKLTLSLISLSKYWNPALQIFTEFRELGELRMTVNNEIEKVYTFDKKLILKNYINQIGDIADSDGVLFIFDARHKKGIDVEWKELVINGLNKLNDNSVVLIGIRTEEDTLNGAWSRYIEDFNLNEYLEEKMISVLFFKITTEYRLEFLDQFNIWLSTINSLSMREE